MRAAMRFVVVLALAGVAACDSTDTPDYDDLSGAWEGQMGGSGQGVTIEATVKATITQKEEELSAVWNLNGKTTFMGESEDIDDTITLTGTVKEGRDPQVSLAFPKDEDDICPDVDPPVFTGSHKSTGMTMELKTDLPVLNDDDCSEVAKITLTAMLKKN
ncbi:MAG: hypothetical protein OXU64_00480 [Gemmatimonadota bacterium]|nr:hypothetical protein [Gemmatimonadota bacterium]